MEIERELLDENINQAPQRPVFLLVLCILTFVGAGLSLIGALISVLTVGQMEESYQQMSDTMGNLGTDIGVNFEDSYKWAKLSNYLNLLGNVLCLAGALFMFKLRKIGYYMYVPGQIIPIIGAYLAMNSMFGGGIFAGFGLVAVVFSSLFALAFIIMYGLNLKHMR